jgi:F0F1-type ATP synthase beta subunit
LVERYVSVDPTFERFGTKDSSSDPDIAPAYRLLDYLRQPFLVAEPFTGRPGEWVSQRQLLDDVEAILQDGVFATTATR